MIDGLHGRCFIKRYGMSALLKRSREELGQLQMSDIGLDAMEQVLEHLGVQ